MPPLIRYVECKFLLGGVTTSQGVKLASNAGIQRFYRGIVRNVEQTDEPDLPEAQGRIPDMAAKDAKSFMARLQREDSCFLLHLSEGVTDAAQPLSAARKHFLALEVAPGEWALSKVFTGIHAAGLLPRTLTSWRGTRVPSIWSPFSNLLLYGGTARVDAAARAGVTIGLGSDWSPTGSKNLLGELKVAWLHSQQALNGQFFARDIIAMATRNAARILKWNNAVGTVEPGKRADLLVIAGATGDPYEALIRAPETDIQLVMINGVARYGIPTLMKGLVPTSETVRVGGEPRALFLTQDNADPDVAQVPCAQRRPNYGRHSVTSRNLPKKPRTPSSDVAPLDTPAAPAWSLALDEICTSCGVELAPRLPFNGPGDFTGPERAPRALAKAAAPLSTILKPVVLDPLTVADDSQFLERVAAQPNVPAPLRKALRELD